MRTLIAILVASAAPAFAQTVAFISNIKGDVAVDGSLRPQLLAELSKGQKLTVGRDAQMNVMYIASGKEYVLKPGEYEVRDTEVASASGMPPMARSTEWRANGKVLAQVAHTSSASVRMRSLAPQKVDKSSKVLFPASGNVSTLQPEFRWQSEDASGAGELTLSIAGEDKPVSRVKTKGLTYRMITKLKPATDYAWTVSMNGAEVGTGTFRTLTAENIAAIEKRRPSDKAEFSDRLLFALYLQEMGAAQEAREAWARLAAERADLPELSSFSK